MANNVSFVLDERLVTDTVAWRNLDLCECRIMNDARFPWCVLVPTLPDLRELFDLSADQQVQVLATINQVAAALFKEPLVSKINVGALGNLVPQLHIHVVGRHSNDAAWPAPVWGFGEPQPYAERALAAFAARLGAQLHT